MRGNYVDVFFYVELYKKELRLRSCTTMRKKILETEDWIVEKDEDNRVVIVSSFEGNHFRDDISISYEDLGIPKELNK
jgi:hypothetical protein